jgi:hypothetical protein
MPAGADTMKKNKRRATKVVALAAVIVLAGGAAAFAWWTAGGSGTGSATTGAASAVTVVQTSAVTGLAPGVSAQTLSGTFNNPNSGPVYVGTVTVSIASVTKAVGAPAGTCDNTDYTLSSNPLAYDAEVLANDTSAWTGPAIAFNNKASNQDACKGATVNLAYSVS